MDTANSPGATGLPVVCTLGPDDGAQRRRRWEALSANGRPNARIRGHVLVVRYQRELGVREELEALAAAERQCCAFVTWTVSEDDDSVVLNVAADPGRPDDIGAIATLFRAA